MGNSVSPLQAAKEPEKDQLSNYAVGPFWSERPDGESVIRYSQKGPASREGSSAMTVAELIAMAARKRPDEMALLQEPPKLISLIDGKKAPPPVPRELWRTWTWSQYYEDVRRVAKGMLSVGFDQHDACTIFGFNSPEWMISAIGAMVAGGKASGVYPSDTAEQFQYKCHHSRSSVVIMESVEHLKLLAKIADRLPYLKAAVVWGGETKEEKIAHVKIFTWDDFLARSERVKDELLDHRINLIRPGYACSLIYTSGTTGQPKAVMVTNDNIIFEARVCMGEGVNHVGGKPTDHERIISYLPLSHVAGQMIDILSPITITGLRAGVCSVFFARPYDLKVGTLGDRLRMVKPTIFLGVPRVWEKIAEKMKAVGAKVTGTKKKLAEWAKTKGLEYQENMQLGGSGRRPSNYGLAEKMILNKVKSALGLDEMKFGFTGAAPITTDTLEFFGALGININEVYGMSECTGATTWSTDQAHIWGTVGFPLLGMEVKVFRISANGKKECPRALGVTNIPDECQGELCFRGRHIMLGYMANPDMGPEHVEEIRKKNSEAIDAEGWLHSGDMGIKTVTGMIKITGRYKELIIGAGGENIAPVPIEDEVKKLSNGVVSNIQMIGDKRKYNIALITLSCKGATGERPGTTELDGPAAKLVPGVTTIEQACKNREFIAAIEKWVNAVNKNGAVCPSNAAKIAKFSILPLDFSVETDELTATLKLKRGVVEKKYAATIEAMYSDDAPTTMFVPYTSF